VPGIRLSIFVDATGTFASSAIDVLAYGSTDWRTGQTHDLASGFDQIPFQRMNHTNGPIR
jgi:hypothetical protein